MLALIVAVLTGEGGFFERPTLDFWGTKRAAPAPVPELWSDSPAPAPVKRLLEAPTPENARAYLEWQKARLLRLQEAMSALESLDRDPAPAPAGGILYFSREGCRYCALQERELEGLPVTKVPADSPLWAEHGVRAVPTLLVGGRIFRGLTARPVLLKELGRD